MGVHYRTVQEWVCWYRRGGLAEVAGHRLGGPRRKGTICLTPEQEEAVRQQAGMEGAATIGPATGWLAETMGISLSMPQMRAVFRRLGLRKKMPRPISERPPCPSRKPGKGGLAASLTAAGMRQGLP